MSRNLPIGQGTEAEIAELRKDAERYRFIRNHVEHDSDEWALFYSVRGPQGRLDWSEHYLDGERHRTEAESLDHAIDTAMAHAKD